MSETTVKPLVETPAALVGALNEAGWLSEEVRAAAVLRQGHAPSLLAAAIGHGLVSVLRPRRYKALPRTFVLGATANQLVGFRARCITHDEDEFYVTIWSEPEAAWPRDLVAVEQAKKGISANATIRVQGQGEIPVTESAEGHLEALIAELGSG